MGNSDVHEEGASWCDEGETGPHQAPSPVPTRPASHLTKGPLECLGTEQEEGCPGWGVRVIHQEHTPRQTDTHRHVHTQTQIHLLIPFIPTHTRTPGWSHSQLELGQGNPRVPPGSWLTVSRPAGVWALTCCGVAVGSEAGGPVPKPTGSRDGLRSLRPHGAGRGCMCSVTLTGSEGTSFLGNSFSCQHPTQQQ